jgi:hypothetical protein
MVKNIENCSKSLIIFILCGKLRISSKAEKVLPPKQFWRKNIFFKILFSIILKAKTLHYKESKTFCHFNNQKNLNVLFYFHINRKFKRKLWKILILKLPLLYILQCILNIPYFYSSLDDHETLGTSLFGSTLINIVIPIS